MTPDHRTPSLPEVRMRRPVHALIGTALAQAALAAALCAPSSAHSTESFAGVVSHVSDGDTLWVQPEAGGAARKLRIDGIDAPEICQAGGPASREVLASRALRQRVLVTVLREDDYGRGLARISIAGQDLGGQMVREGQAWSYRWRHHLGPYAAEEAAARRAGRGLFAATAAELPRDFRKRHGPCQGPKP
jgi:endonuclease YncB( thermonuclease family)